MKTFYVTASAIEEGTLLKFTGELDASSSVQADQALEEAIASTSGYIFIDCSELVYISSAGLGVLLAAFQDCNMKDVQMVMVDMKPKIRNVFEILGLDRLIKSAASVEEAKQLVIK